MSPHIQTNINSPPKRPINVLAEFKVFQSIVLNDNNSKRFLVQYSIKNHCSKTEFSNLQTIHLKQEQLLGRFTQQE